MTLEDIALVGHAPVLPAWQGSDWKEWTDAERKAFELGKKAATDAIVVAMLGSVALDLKTADPSRDADLV